MSLALRPHGYKLWNLDLTPKFGFRALCFNRVQREIRQTEMDGRTDR